MSGRAAVLLDGLVFPESPRWHADKLWFSDIYGHRIINLSLEGHATTFAEFEQSEHPSGLGFLPDGSPIVVLMFTNRLVRHNGTIWQDHADLAHLRSKNLNDMVVDLSGRAFLDCWYEPVDSEPSRDCIVVVDPDGSCRTATQGGLVMPNGLAISSDGKTLIVAIGPLHRLMAYTITIDGALREGRIYAQTDDHFADGVCLDKEGAVWMASLWKSQFVRMLPGGIEADCVEVAGKSALSCVLGGSDRRTLFMATTIKPDNPIGGPHGNYHLSEGFIEVATVDVPGAGIP